MSNGGRRLTDAKSFDAVFRGNRFRVSSSAFLFLAMENHLDQSRLGLVIGKKHVKLATQRNRIKRVIRENFRLQFDEFSPCIDLVVLAKAGVNPREKSALHDQMQELMNKLKRKMVQR